VKSLQLTGVDAASRAAIACSRRRKCVTSFWSRTARALLAFAAIEVGVWAGLEVSPHPTRGTISLVHGVGEASSRGFKEIEAEAPLPSDCVQIGKVEMTANHSPSFRCEPGTSGHRRSQAAVLQTFLINKDVWSGTIPPPSASTNSWDLVELIRVTPDSAIAAHNR